MIIYHLILKFIWFIKKKLGKIEITSFSSGDGEKLGIKGPTVFMIEIRSGWLFDIIANTLIDSHIFNIIIFGE